MKKRIILIIFAVFLVLLFLSSNTYQAPPIEWQKSFGGSDDDLANSIQQTSDNGYIIAGWTKSNDGDVSDFHGGYTETIGL